MKAKDNIVTDYKNTKIDLTKLDERESYLKELLEGIQTKRKEVKAKCSHPLFVYFGRSYYNFESRNTHIAKCICCGQGQFFKDGTMELNKFKKSVKVFDLTEIIDSAENFLIPSTSWYEENFQKIREIVDEIVFSKNEMDVYELKGLVKKQFQKANEETIKKLGKNRQIITVKK